MKITGAVILAALWIAASPSSHAREAAGEPLILGVVDTAPYSMKQPDGSWEGLGIDLWDAAAHEMGLEYEVREYASLGKVLDALRAGEVAATPTIAASVRNEVDLDLSHSYFQSGVAIAVRGRPTSSRWLGVAERFFSLDFLRVIGVLLLLWLIAGAMVWLSERRRNPEMFPGDTLSGLGTGIWWAAVTMTTVGYGDKAPRTLGGRTVTIVWMLASVILISGFTAAITTSLTVRELSGEVRGLRDLGDVRVGSVRGSESLRFLGEHRIAAQPFASGEEALGALVSDEIDAFVFDELILRHLARAEFPGRVRVLPRTFDHYQIKVGLPAGSALREPLNRALLKVLEEGTWRQRAERYIGPDH